MILQTISSRLGCTQALRINRIRMDDVQTDPGVFIRSMGSRGSLGGLSRATMDAVRVLDAAGYDLILVETVGAGQSEVEIVRTAHCCCVLGIPGTGDAVQAIKAGIMEIADIYVVNKADRPGAKEIVTELKLLLSIDPLIEEEGRWKIPIISTSNIDGTGIVRGIRHCYLLGCNWFSEEEARLAQSLIDQLKGCPQRQG